ncbi:MAG: WecB/TagA/CpsF family glycosyltransferase [Rhodospirillales bacterium]|nr:WecB/TagA/CpsF family glycosyltransferase [Rhodospirillales bacterium]
MNFFGLSFCELSLPQICETLLGRPANAPFAYVVTPNADHLDRLRRNPTLRPAYDAALFRLFDSRFLAQFVKLLGRKPPVVVTGADLTAVLLPNLAGERVAVVGMEDDAFAALRGRFPHIGFLRHNPPMGLLHNPVAFAEAAHFVASANACFVFFAIGSPVQEILAQEVLRHGKALGLGLCIGAALEFAAGTRRRAPAWMQRAGLEWLHRLCQEPRRLGPRYLLRAPRVPVLLLAEAVGFRAGSNR